MAINSKGTQLYIYLDDTVQEVECVTTIGRIGGTRESTETAPCLKDGSTVKFVGGLTWDDSAPQFNFDPQNDTHIALWNEFVAGTENLPMIVCFSDGEAAPTWDGEGGKWDIEALEVDRSSISFFGSISAAGIEPGSAGDGVVGDVSIIVNTPSLNPKDK